MQAHPLALSELVGRLRWFVALRWLAAAGIAVATVALRWLGEVDLPVVSLLLIAAAVAAVNAIYWLYFRQPRGDEALGQGAVRIANVQITIDLVLLTLLLHFVGAVENPFSSYYVFHIIIASILLPALATYLQATLAFALFAALAGLEFFGLVPHVSISSFGGTGLYRNGGFVLAALSAFGSTLYLAAYFATTIVGRLRQREDEVLELKDALQSEQTRLQAAYRQLQQTEQAKARYMRTVGHQLRAPLAAMQTLLSSSLDRLPGSAFTARDLIERAQRRAREMLRLVDDLLALSRVREVRLVSVARPVALDELARRVVEVFGAEAGAKGVALDISLPDNPVIVQGDPVGLEDVLANLVSNGIKYTATGGSVRVGISTNDGGATIRVADTGIGMAPEDLKHVFEEFYRSERARSWTKEGTGLGLTIVRAVVEAHGGQISVESAPDQGTTFTVTLPMSREVDQASRPGPDLLAGRREESTDSLAVLGAG